MRTGLLLLLVTLFEIALPQDYTQESLMLSRTGISGTARTAGSAGAYNSVGADLGSVVTNPAGLGLYRSSDFCVTPGLKAGNNEANYNGSNANTTLTKLYLAQLGFAWTFMKRNPRNEMTFNPNRLRSITFSFNYQRENFFTRNQSFNSTNTVSSVIDNYVDYANGKRLTDLTFDNAPPELVLAANAGLITFDSISGNHFSNVRAPVQQLGSIASRGGLDRIDLALGGNINDKLYFGFGIGIPFISYSSNISFSESNPNGLDTLTGFQNYNIQSTLRVDGVGVTGTLGLIYRPANWVRLGAAYHLPTWYSLTENYYVDLLSFTSSTSYNPTVQYDPFHYKLRTPMKGSFGASFYYKSYGFLSVDYDVQNLGASRYNFGSDYAATTQQTNDSIKAYYKFNHTIRFGIEGAIKVMRLRAGYSVSTSPYKKGEFYPGYNEMRHYATVGIGVRLKHFYADMAYVFGFTKDAAYPIYSTPVGNTYMIHSVLLTIGWKMFREQKSSNSDNSGSDNNRRRGNGNYGGGDGNEQRY